jgi:hypothetical protein
VKRAHAVFGAPCSSTVFGPCANRFRTVCGRIHRVVNDRPAGSSKNPSEQGLLAGFGGLTCRPSWNPSWSSARCEPWTPRCQSAPWGRRAHRQHAPARAGARRPTRAVRCGPPSASHRRVGHTRHARRGAVVVDGSSGSGVRAGVKVLECMRDSATWKSRLVGDATAAVGVRPLRCRKGAPRGGRL